jgi:hypothetical protein
MTGCARRGVGCAQRRRRQGGRMRARPRSQAMLDCRIADHRAARIISIAATVMIPHTSATMPVNPSTSARRRRVTASSGIAQNGCIRFVLESPYAQAVPSWSRRRRARPQPAADTAPRSATSIPADGTSRFIRVDIDDERERVRRGQPHEQLAEPLAEPGVVDDAEDPVVERELEDDARGRARSSRTARTRFEGRPCSSSAAIRNTML